MGSLFSQRSQEIELMDDLGSSGAVIDQTLRELEKINKWLGGNHVTIDGLDKLLKRAGQTQQKLVIVDIGCGGGDMLMLMARWARKKNVKTKFIGVDANPNIVDFARKNTRAFPEITYQAMNIFSQEFETLHCDIITATLFTHHFSDKQLIKLFQQIKGQAKIGMVINDLHRHWFAYHSIKMLTSIFSRSPMVRNDAAVSVLRSFDKKDIESILHQSGIPNYSIQWMWAFRWQVVAGFD